MKTSSSIVLAALCGSVAASATLGCSGGDDEPRASGGSAGSASGGNGAASGGSSSGGTSGGSGSGGQSGGSAGAPSNGPTAAELIGLDGFIDDPPELLAAIGNVREYHQWGWNDGNGAAGYPGYPNNALEFSLWNGFWDFDAYYADLGERGVLVFPAIQGSVAYLNGVEPPVGAGGAKDDPASYLAHASFMYQYAARYGKVQVAEQNLKLASGQVKASGLGTLSYFENGNEPDNNWTLPGGAQIFSPEAYAAMSSADYDGHQGKLGSTFGIKAADPSAKLVMAGLAGAGASGDWLTDTTAYLDAMRAWANAHRGGSFPADVVNVHYYCFGDSEFSDPDPNPAMAPEACGLAQKLAAIVAYRDQHLPGKEIWLTELGYDTHPKSRLRAPAIGASSAELVQAQWLARSFLELMTSGIDRAFAFVSRDACTGADSECPDNHVQFSTSGLWSEKGQNVPKTSFYFVATLRARLASMRFIGSVPAADPAIRILRFYSAYDDRGAYVIWSATSEARTVTGYQLPLDALRDPRRRAGQAASATVVELVDGTTTGSVSEQTSTGGTLSLDVTESPTIVLVDGQP